jgi:hypothetical protein
MVPIFFFILLAPRTEYNSFGPSRLDYKRNLDVSRKNSKYLVKLVT